MPDVPVWGPPYPDPSQIRADVDAMADSVAGSLLDRFGDAIAGLWFKGCAQKRWDTPLDYVPEISDVDIHVRSAAAGALDAISDVEVAVAIHADIERRFRVRRPSRCMCRGCSLSPLKRSSGSRAISPCRCRRHEPSTALSTAGPVGWIRKRWWPPTATACYYSPTNQH